MVYRMAIAKNGKKKVFHGDARSCEKRMNQFWLENGYPVEMGWGVSHFANIEEIAENLKVPATVVKTVAEQVR